MSTLIDKSPDGTGEARFSPCRKFRYSLRRFLTDERRSYRSVCFVMLNPSTADAFKLDPTVSRCCEFARRWGFDVIDVVNLFALRSPHPRDLYDAPALDRGAGQVNSAHIIGVCSHADRVIAAWGNHGDDRRLNTRGSEIRDALEHVGVELHHLGTSQSGSPLHPLARGKSWIPYDREPVRWGGES